MNSNTANVLREMGQSLVAMGQAINSMADTVESELVDLKSQLDYCTCEINHNKNKMQAMCKEVANAFSAFTY